MASLSGSPWNHDARCSDTDDDWAMDIDSKSVESNTSDELVVLANIVRNIPGTFLRGVRAAFGSDQPDDIK